MGRHTDTELIAQNNLMLKAKSQYQEQALVTEHSGQRIDSLILLQFLLNNFRINRGEGVAEMDEGGQRYNFQL